MIGIKIRIIFSLFSVLIGAFGAHVLKDILIKLNTSDIFHTAVKYHMFHSIAIILSGLMVQFNLLENNFPIILFSFGILIFSGSLYALSISGIKWLGAITPIGGVMFILGWFLLFFKVLKMQI